MMHLRKRRKLGLWIFGILCLCVTFYGCRSLHKYYRHAQLRMKLRPGVGAIAILSVKYNIF